MKKVSCEVIRDLLPLYVDDAANQETRELVQEHLNTCPYCREELRMMRSLVSLPPDEDTELVLQTFRERQTRKRRNKKIAMISAVSAVALIILLCLWYVRPRSWAELAGSDEVDAVFSASLTEYNFRPYEDWEITSSWDRWRLDEAAGDAGASALILSALEGSSYRADLGNLRNYTPFPRDILEGKGSDTIHLTLLTQQRGQFISLTLDSGGQASIYTSWQSRGGIIVYQADDGLYQTLANLVREYGTLEKD